MKKSSRNSCSAGGDETVEKREGHWSEEQQRPSIEAGKKREGHWSEEQEKPSIEAGINMG